MAGDDDRVGAGRPGAKADPHPGMMGDGTEEQNLGQPGDPGARITEGEVREAFGGGEPEAGKDGAPKG